MESKRQAKINSLLQRELSTLFLKNAKKWVNHSFITVSSVHVSPDLSIAKVYVTFMNDPNPLVLCEKLNDKEKEIKGLLASALRNNLRKMPSLKFFYDDTLDYVDKMEKIFQEIKPSLSDSESETPADEEDKNEV